MPGIGTHQHSDLTFTRDLQSTDTNSLAEIEDRRTLS